MGASVSQLHFILQFKKQNTSEWVGRENKSKKPENSFSFVQYRIVWFSILFELNQDVFLTARSTV